ncbi:MAG TPA: hypothetical protein PKI46_00110 [Bacteroidales bacterium]|nr:hypothetical protein [Bacteroidales bacterium]
MIEMLLEKLVKEEDGFKKILISNAITAAFEAKDKEIESLKRALENTAAMIVK